MLQNMNRMEAELQTLALPPFAGKSFLEIGCSKGLFCGFAWFEGATGIMGLDNDETALEKARIAFPACKFARFSGNFARILSQKDGFDVILCSALPAGMTINNLLPLMLKKLNRSGTIILKAPKNYFSVMTDCEVAFVYKDMGESISDSTDGVLMHVFHIKNKEPYAILLMGESGSGKTTIARTLFPDLPIISGDDLMRKLANLPEGSLASKYPYLNDICNGGKNNLTVGGIMIQIFNSAAGKQYACMVAELAAGNDFVYEGVIHSNFRHVFVTQLERLGYKVLSIDIPDPANSPNELFKAAKRESRKYRIYLEAIFRR